METWTINYVMYNKIQAFENNVPQYTARDKVSESKNNSYLKHEIIL